MNNREKSIGSLALNPSPRRIIIPAADQDHARHLRVAAYARVSSDSSDQLHSYAAQTAYFAKLINSDPNWTFVDVYADKGITGTSTSKRKNFLRMIRQCRQGKIDLILTKSISRFARNTVDTLNYTRELRSLGIPVIFEEHGLNSIYPESEFLITIFGAQAQAESESTSSRVRWGVQQSMRDGRASIQYKYLLGYRKGIGCIWRDSLSEISGRALCPRDAGTPSVRRSGPPAISKPS